MTGGTEFGADRLPAAVLPDDRVVQRLSRPALKDDDRFTLVRDAHAEQIVEFEPPHRRQRVLPDLLGVMLDPTRLRINLAMIDRRLVEQLTGGVIEQGLRGGGAL